MSTTLFPFRIQWLGQISEDTIPLLEVVVSEAKTHKVRKLASNPGYEHNAFVVLSGDKGHSYADWLAFRNGTLDQGAATVLVKPESGALREVLDESIGTVTGSGETFALDSKFIHHTDFGENASTLVVKVAGVTQTLTTDYTVSGNGTAPLITSTASMDTGAATASYQRYIQAHVFQSGPKQSRRLDGTPDLNNPRPEATYVPVRIVEATAGAYLV